MAELNAALIAIAGVLAGGFVNNFLAEDYKRFRDGRALAGALAGELQSHSEAIPWIKVGLENMGNGLRDGQKLTLPEWPAPPSPLFDENVGKIGLLGPAMSGDVAYVYENLRAFRQSFHQLSKNHETMPVLWSQASITGCLAAITRAEARGAQLVVNLKNHAEARYWDLPETRTQLKWAAGGLAAFLIVLKLFA